MGINKRLKKVIENSKILDKDKNVKVENFENFLNLLNVEYTQQEEQIEKLNIILDTNPCTISWVTEDIKYIGVNKTLADICKLKKENFPGEEVGYYTEDKYFFNFTKDLFAANELTHYDELNSIINGEAKKFWVVGTKFDSNKQAIIIGMDITELKSMESTISLMEKLSSLGEMVASIIHEVNNPLAMIKLQSMQIKKYVEKEQYEKITDIADRIDVTTERISKLIVGIKSFVRRGDNDPKQQASLNKIISDAHTICEGRVKENGVVLTHDSDQDIMLNCNITHIFQIFVNLITNSIDAIHSLDEKWIKIEVIDNAAEVLVNFTDSGKGIDKELATKVFDNFFTTKDVGKGTGIGLALCKKIMTAHNGDIFYNDKFENTTFTLKFTK